MSTILQVPLFRYGVAIVQAVVLVAVAYLVIDPGTTRMAVLLLAGVELVTTPWILARAAEEATEDDAAWT